MPGQQEVDAVLRGEAATTPEIDAMIANLDHALAGRPTPDPIVVWLPTDAAHLGGLDDLEGRRVMEPTFLQVRFDTPEAQYGDAAVVLKLRGPAGVPAVYLSPGGEADAGVLLLGRGLTWTATRVVAFPDRTFVFGEIAG